MRITTFLPILLTACCLSSAPAVFAQTTTTDTEDSTEMTAPAATDDQHNSMTVSVSSGDDKAAPTRKWYLSNGFDGGLFQTAFLRRPNRHDEFTYLRFSYFLNLSFDFNYDFDNNFGFFTGIGIKNIGFTQKESDSTIKRRVYTLGVPLGFKIGNLEKRRFMLIGGGLDVPFNYREKGWKDRHHKTKMNEWFSDRTEDVMPYVFVGMSVKKSLTLKLQYYPSNFLDKDYTQTNNDGTISKPFSDWDSHLLYLSLGLDLHYKSKANGSMHHGKPKKKMEMESDK